MGEIIWVSRSSEQTPQENSLALPYERQTRLLSINQSKVFTGAILNFGFPAPKTKIK